jgi:hypothetical protein
VRTPEKERWQNNGRDSGNNREFSNIRDASNSRDASITGDAGNSRNASNVRKAIKSRYTSINRDFMPGSSGLDTDPHPDSYVFGPPGSASGSVSHKNGSGSFPFLIEV